MKLNAKFFTVILTLYSFFLFSQNIKDSFIIINGTTNVNSFKCVNDDFHQLIPLSLENSPKNKFSETSINLIVKDFDCKNKMMTSDFRNTLNEEKYPFLNVTFLTLEKIADNKFRGFVQVKMMNKLKKYYIDFSLENSKLVGNKKLKFSDFGIVPPKKLGGLIAVKDSLDLAFSLKIKQ